MQNTNTLPPPTIGTPITSVRPSYFSEAGIPSCSCWCKTEIEYLAWAYVTAQARNGDAWVPITPDRAAKVLTDEEQDICALRFAATRYHHWWDAIAEKLVSAEGAFKVGGLAWSRGAFERKHGPLI